MATRVFVFSKTADFHHESIPTGVEAIQQLWKENGFDVDTTTDAAMFNEDSLKIMQLGFPEHYRRCAQLQAGRGFRKIYTGKAAAMLACTRQQIQNMIGAGTAGWLVAILTDIQNHRKQNLW